MTTTDILGLVAAALTTFSWVPQIVQIRRTQDTRAISLGMQAAFALGVALWLFYGLLIGSMPVIAANAVALVLVSWIVVMKLRYG